MDLFTNSVSLLLGDCLQRVKELPDNSIDSIVSDPPYHLASIVKRFGKEGSAPAQHGTDGAYARASVGFMGKEWDGGDIAFRPETWAEFMRVLKPGGHLLAFNHSRSWHRLTVAIEDAGFEIRDSVLWLYGTGFPKSHNISKAIDKIHGATREVTGPGKYMSRKPNKSAGVNSVGINGDGYNETAAATPDAEEWEGWGTALKPAFEPVVMGRKPLSEKTVAANVLKWGTGAINIDSCRVGGEIMNNNSAGNKQGGNSLNMSVKGMPQDIKGSISVGRFPANVLHDGSEPIVNIFPDGGNAARFFYSAKASKADRGAGNDHPTVKPTELMRYLCRLVTPPGGVVFDPFLGSGSTGRAALMEGFRFVGIEQDSHYYSIACGRIFETAIDDHGKNK